MSMNSILSPAVRTGYIGDPAQKYKYLEIPFGVTPESFAKDVKGGAAQFGEVLSLTKKEDSSNYIVITADSLENAYMAVMYHAACTIPSDELEEAVFDHDNGEQETDPEPAHTEIEMDPLEMDSMDPEEDEEAWDPGDECDIPANAVPIITYGEFQSEFSDRNVFTPFQMGHLSGIGSGMPAAPRPFWTNITYSPICIMCMDESDYQSCYSMEDNDDILDELSMFSGNCAVYLLFVKPEEKEDIVRHTPLSGRLSEDFMDDDSAAPLSFFDLFKSKIVLSTLAEEITVRTEDSETWLKYLIKNHAELDGHGLKKGFPYKRLFSAIKKISEDKPAAMVSKIMRYAARNKKTDTPYCITDFSFMERFITVRAKTKRSTKGWQRLDRELIGLEQVKQEVRDVVNVMKFNRLRAQMNIDGASYHNVHLMLGAPGTAKTTVAQIMGEIMAQEGLLPGNRFICVNGAELKGMYVGHSAPKTHQLFAENDIIVIDEAYSLVAENGRNDPFSVEALAQLVIEIETHSTDKLVILAGYGGKYVTERNDKMKLFLDANPGIRSRITHTFLFDSYRPEDMVEIFYRQAENMHFSVDGSARDSLREYFSERTGDRNFGNGREARSLLESSVVFAARRVMKAEKDSYKSGELKTLETGDIEAAIAHKRDTMGGLSPSNKVFGFSTLQ